MNQRSIKVCFVSAHAYPVINPQAGGLFGGMETRSWCFARQIAKLPNVNVTFVVTHRTAPRRSIVDGVDVVEATRLMEWYHQDLSDARKAWRNDRRFPWSRLPELSAKFAAWAVTRPFRTSEHRRWTIPSKWLTGIDADVYVGFGVNAQAVWTSLSASAMNRPFVLCLASDSDVDERFISDPEFTNPYGASAAHARELFERSDGIVVQTSHQQRQLKSLWRRDSELIANPLEIEAWDQLMSGPSPTETPNEPFVLWVGRADRFSKRPLEMLPVIQAFPEIPFVMVINPSESDVLSDLLAPNCHNLTVIPKVSQAEMAALMRASSIFATTSSAAYEGIPNTLIQAAAAARPIVSLEACAEWLQSSGAGVCLSGDRAAFVSAVGRFAEGQHTPQISRYGDAGRHYVEREHDAKRQSNKLHEVLRAVAEKRQTHSA